MIIFQVPVIPVKTTTHPVFKDLSPAKTIDADHDIALRFYKQGIVKNNIIALTENGKNSKVSLAINLDRVITRSHIANTHIVIIRLKPAPINDHPDIALICRFDCEHTFRPVGSEKNNGEK